MSPVVLDIPTDILQHVEKQLADGKYATTQAYILDLLRHDRTRAHLEELIIEGIESGPATPFTQGDWDELEQIIVDYENSHKISNA